MICGVTDSVLEQHHVAGRSNYPDTITLCGTCHDELSQVYQPKWIQTQRKPLTYYFLGWSDVFHVIWQKTGCPYFFELSKTFALNSEYTK
jgi:hypothetical protein